MLKKDLKSEVFHGIGRRKQAVARVWLRRGTGDISVNGKALQDYFPTSGCINKINRPAKLAEYSDKVSIDINVCGGGFNGQADAAKLGIARAILEMDAGCRGVLKKQGLLSVDSRIKERKKPGQPAARKKFQFVKR